MNKPITLSLLILASLAGCSGGPATEAASEPEALVTLATATLGEPAETVTVYGAASAGPASEGALSAPIEASIVSIDAPTGTQVQSGQPIVTLQPSPSAALDISRATNDAVVAEAAYARAQRLRSDGLMSDADVESARAAAASAEAARSSLARRADALTIRAPASGTVEMIAGSPGDLVAAGAPVARIAAPGNIRGRFGIDPMLARRIVPGADVRITPAPADTPAYDVKITSVDPVADPQTRLASLYAPLPPQANLAIGETLRGVVTIGRRSGVVTIPYAALLDDGGETYVFTVEDGIAKRRTVTTGAEENGVIEIRSGLESGARVVVSGGTALEDGTKVRVAE